MTDQECKDAIVTFGAALGDMSRAMVVINKHWWTSPHTGDTIQRNVGELLMLTVSELAEGMEGHRKGLFDDHLPHFPMLTVELADAIIRILDMGGNLNLSIDRAFIDKMAYNAVRADHKAENRILPGGKAY